MIQAVSSSDARTNRFERESKSGSGARFFRSDFIAPPGYDIERDDRATLLALYEKLKDEPEAPQAYLVDQQCGTVPPHFHRVPQFQVVAEGSGKLGRRDVSSVAVHYTDAYTGYGPIVAGERGLAYFVMRVQYDPGAVHLAEAGARELLKPSRKRHFIAGADQVAVSARDTLMKRAASVLDEVIPAQDDGVAGYVLRVPPGGRARGPNPASTGGQFYLVVNGDLELDAKKLPFLSCVFVSRRDEPLEVAAGASGLEALVLQFPKLD